MDINAIPFNIQLLMLKDSDVKNIRPIKALDIFEGMSRNFHKDGLFSTEIFGRVGEERRNRLFSYIDLHVEVLHPILYRALSELKSLYEEIISGRTYAIYNPETKDFEKSDIVNGLTGYGFFLKHVKDLEFETRPSAKREFNISLVNQYRASLTFSKLIVMPAGLRDYEIDDNGKPSEDEINGLYRKVYSIAEMIETVSKGSDNQYLDNARYNLQLRVNEVYAYIKNILEGKHGFILDKWSSRKIYNSTRNVITSYIHTATSMDSPNNVGTNQTVVGMYQFLRATLPLSIKNVRDSYLSEILIGPNSPAMLVNKRTLMKESVQIDPDYYDSWMTNEGLETLFAKYGQENLRHDVVEIADRYLALIYKGPDGTFKVFSDIGDLPEGRSREHVSPITLTELLYLSVFRGSDEIPCLVTRYPVTGYGSIYPSYCYLKTTVQSEIRRELDQNWEIIPDYVVSEFPIFGEGFVNGLSPNCVHLGRMGADFDGYLNKFKDSVPYNSDVVMEPL